MDGLSTGSAFAARRSGVLLHPTSLPGPFGSGDLGPAARAFVDFLAQAGQGWWQMLPVHPPDSAASPYLARSTFAGSPLLVSPEDLVGAGWLEPDELEPIPARSRVSFRRAHDSRMRMLGHAFGRFESQLSHDHGLREELARFEAAARHWLPDWCLYSALKNRARGRHWCRWRRAVREREPEALSAAREELAHDLRWHRFVQFLFMRQWDALRWYAGERGVKLLGDLPFFIAGDSADAWSRPELFCLDEHGQATHVAGTPPDVFTETGQLWGNPLYRWTEHANEDFAWWRARIARALELFDGVRLDHFIGYVRHWSIPAGAADARDGHYVDGPGSALFDRLESTQGFVAEDLGDVGDDVEALRNELDLPGIRVLVFAFGDDRVRHLPASIEENNLCHPASHDNDTVRGWYESLPEHAPEGEASQHAARQLFATEGHSVSWGAVRTALESRAKTAIVQAQDLLGLDSRARMNRPGTTANNWRWRLRPGQLVGDSAETTEALRALTEKTGRLAGS